MDPVLRALIGSRDIPEEAVYIRRNELGHYELSIALPHYLDGVLIRDSKSAELEQRLMKWAEGKGPYDSWEDIVFNFVKSEAGLDFRTMPYHPNGQPIITEFINHHLDQNFWTILFTDGSEYYAVVRVKCGSVTGAGYSDPAVFRVRDIEDFLDWFIDVHCPECDNDDPNAFIVKEEELVCRQCKKPACYWHWSME